MENPDQFTLQDKYVKQQGTIILSGIQALVRLPLDQHKADKRAGLNTATFISGYRGSPLGGLDTMLMRNKSKLEENNIKFLPGVNEDLGATAVYGSQIANVLPNPKFDGVLGMWYGKAPGVDRSGDIFKHANFAGVGDHGGVLAIAGDDPISKSSTLPSHSEVAFYDAMIPVLYPGNVQEIITMGRLGFEMSRYSGLWVGMKVVTDVADGFGTADVSPINNIVKPDFEYNGKIWKHNQNPTLLPHIALQQEKELYQGRLKAATLFAEKNNLNQITVKSHHDKIGIVSAGKSYYDVREALYLMGLSNNELEEYGIRILKLGMIFPLEPNIVHEFAESLDEIIVIEEKRGLIETLLKEILYNSPTRPLIIGKENEHGEELIPPNGELVVKDIYPLILQRLEKYLPTEIVNKLQEEDDTQISLDMAPVNVPRTPYFCSGCPHNRSTVVPEGSLAGGGIGCHGLALTMDRNTIGLLHMGGEGVPWVGASYFSDTPHMFQNLGDGTLFHSGYLAIRQAIAAKTNITYKILYNSAVAMTGGQPADGNMPVPDLTRALEAEGVKRTIVLADDPSKYPRRSKWAKNVDIWHRDKLDKAQLELRETEGVTVLIYDQPCAADLRRKRKRGKAETPKQQVFINERVCEGCGDCGEKSNCLSVFPVDTEFGRKTQIHQASCNRDYTCLKGDCPAFVTVEVDENNPVTFNPLPKTFFDTDLPNPEMKVGENANIYMTGVGGTGVVTTTQIIATAALLDGKYSNNLDQTGLSQKGGPVVSHIKLRQNNTEISNRIPYGETDTFLIFDILSGATDKNLKYADPDKTIAVVSRSELPTGAMVRSTSVEYPEIAPLISRVERKTKSSENVYLDAIQLAENIFGSHMPANMITFGAAYQTGLIPISQEAIFTAIELNGVAVETNKQAFQLGRMIVDDPDHKLMELEEKLIRIGSLDHYDRPELNTEQQELLDQISGSSDLVDIIRIRIQELTEYQNISYAEDYVNFIKTISKKDPQEEFTLGVAKYLYKLMAYKDEYEVARLYLKDDFEEELQRQFGSNYKMKYQLHPPIFRSLGRKNKIGFGTWFKLGYKILYKLRGLRGTIFDIFGYAHIRREERRLIKEYRQIISEEAENLDTDTYQIKVQIANLPDMIRGYEDVKDRNIKQYRDKLEELRKETN